MFLGRVAGSVWSTVKWPAAKGLKLLLVRPYRLEDLPANGVAGNNIVTNVIGARWKPGGHLETGFGWEYPLSQNGDILKNRVYADLILRY